MNCFAKPKAVYLKLEHVSSHAVRTACQCEILGSYNAVFFVLTS